MTSLTPSSDIPLCIDLDGTLIRSDLLVESALDLLRKNPFYIFHFALWLLGGKAHLKRRIAERATLDVETLPYDDRILAWMRREAERRPVILCTASDQMLADAVATHLGGFAAVLGSDGVQNLSGRHKARVLCDRYGEGGFDYVGNGRIDLAVWRRARHAVVANAGSGLVREVETHKKVEKTFELRQLSWRTWGKALRLHQWLKNLLLFLPLLAAHRVFDPNSILQGGLAFISFGLCASGTYLLNDLLDLQADRRHVRKKLRPLASGALPLSWALIAAPLFTLLAFGLASALSVSFVAVLLLYLVLTLAYSFRLKRVVMLDVVVLAGLYTVRIIAGTVAIRVKYSFWLLAFSMFLFLSLAMLKRYTELLVLQTGRQRIVSGRGYTVDDLPLLQSLGSSSGYLSVLVLALYINSTASVALYHHPHVLWLLCPLLLYWISRVWVVAHRGQMHDDPVIFAITDRVSIAVLALVILVVLGAT